MNNKLKELKNTFIKGELSKKNYIRKMHEMHKNLFDYVEFIKETNIKKIEINSNNVIMTTNKDNIKLVCDNIDERIIPIEMLNFGDYEEDILYMINNLLKDNFTIFDIGANIGYHSIKYSIHNRKCKINSFEPIPKTYNYLTKNIEINKIKNIKTFNLAFSNYDGEAEFYYYPEGSANASAVNLGEIYNMEKIKCKVVKIDSFVKENNISVDFIKCDVEGGELLTFKGGIETLERDKPIIFTEILRKWSEKFHYDPNEIIELFRNLGYKCFTLKNNMLEIFEIMTEDTLDTNFIFLHEQKHGDEINKYLKIN
ncbi:FkbM family methyltransferase [Clostridium akagii]|uniref:FkbM family methyltransferase n=1 Tax=Clostridium akagii TaxID=91623 RepID=UPI00047C01FB|nr:FkbM family methyltransferase [Clostridium akagii]